VLECFIFKFVCILDLPPNLPLPPSTSRHATDRWRTSRVTSGTPNHLSWV